MSASRACPFCGDTFNANRFNAGAGDSALWSHFRRHLDRCERLSPAERERSKRLRASARTRRGHGAGH